MQMPQIPRSQQSDSALLLKSMLSKVFQKAGAEPSTRQWKPASLGAPVLFSCVAFSFMIIAILEALASKSTKEENGGGLIFARDANSFSNSGSFALLYFPTILAVAYSMLWSWIDLDAKRLEPWFQLSKAGGESSDNSLLLQYPYDFLPFVPITAFRRRHWNVFFSGTTMLLILWVITPLQSAIFNTGVVTRKVNVLMETSGSLIPIEAQTFAMTTNFLYTAYGVLWLNQSLPPFTTREFAMLPFQPLSSSESMAELETWETVTDVYSTNLICTPSLTSFDNATKRYRFENGRGCAWEAYLHYLTPNTSYQEDYSVMYIGWHRTPSFSKYYDLGSPNCSNMHSSDFLAIYASAKGQTAESTYSDLTAQFCTPAYEVQQMTVTVNASSGAVLRSNPLAEKVVQQDRLKEIFNTTLFEAILGTGINPAASTFSVLDRQYNYPEVEPVEQWPVVRKYSIKSPLRNMVGFAVGANNVNVQELADPLRMQEFFARAHSMIFPIAFSQVIQEAASHHSNETRPGVIRDETYAIVLVRPIGIAVEVAFGIVGLLVISLWYTSSRRSSYLCRDPASIAKIMSMLPTCGSTLDFIRDDGLVTATMLEKTLFRKRFHLSLADTTFPMIEAMSGDADSVGLVTRRSDKPLVPFKPVRALEHRLYFGALFSGALVSASAVLMFIQRWSSSHNGITLPSQNQVVRSLIQNYAPTTFATILEPMWVILSRLLCLLQPFEVLRHGHAIASKSINLKYTSLPPQLAIWRAFRSKHFLLAIVSLVTVSTNLLAVSLARLLSENQVTEGIPYQTTQDIFAQINQKGFLGLEIRRSYSDHFYVALSNATTQNALPSWLDKEHFYLPFRLNTTIDAESNNSILKTRSYSASTIGIGANVICTPLIVSSTSTNIPNSAFFAIDSEGFNILFSTSHRLPDGNTRNCISAWVEGPDQPYRFKSKLGREANGLEMLRTLTPVLSLNNRGYDFCDSLMVAGWARVSAFAPEGRAMDTRVLACQPQMRVAKFDITVDSTGRILSSNRTSSFHPPTPGDRTSIALNDTVIPLFANNTARVDDEIAAIMTNIIAPFSPGLFLWHNDTFSGDWFNHLLVARAAHGMPDTYPELKGLLDPLSPLPNSTVLASAVSGLYKQLYATILALNADDIFSHYPTPIPIEAEIQIEITKIFVSDTMYKLSLVILLVHLVTAVAYYVFRPRRFLTRMPTSIASIIAYVSCSRALDDFTPNSGAGKKAIDENEKEQVYGYGRFIGRDGKTHVGIEKMRYVIPLESENPATRGGSWLRWRGKKSQKGEGGWI